MGEIAHAETGIDVHPGATIGPGCFIDHGTGVVIGETTVIGGQCTIYQGVTLGALRFPTDDAGRVVKGQRRHPTLEDGVTVYANATILGGATVIGAGSTIAGGVFVTESVPAGSVVHAAKLDVTVKPRRSAP
jgi:serine O-acetyltransferase